MKNLKKLLPKNTFIVFTENNKRKKCKFNKKLRF